MDSMTMIESLARRGAVARVAELRSELAEIGKHYPDVVDAPAPLTTSNRKKAVRHLKQLAAGRRHLSAAGRKAISAAQKARWERYRAKR